MLYQGQHDRGLAAARHSVKQGGVGLARIDKIAQGKIGLALLVVEDDGGELGQILRLVRTANVLLLLLDDVSLGRHGGQHRGGTADQIAKLLVGHGSVIFV